MRANSWAGLITNASPFVLPPGAAVQQVNLEGSVPGQISARGGMRKVAAVGVSADILDCYPYDHNGYTTLVAMAADGTLIAMDRPAYGAEPSTPFEPKMETTGAIVSSSYTQRYVEGDYDPIGTDVANPTEALCASAIDGGTAFTALWEKSLDAQTCQAIPGDSGFSGGSATASAECGDELPPGLCGGGNATANEPGVPRNLTVAFSSTNPSAAVSWQSPESDGGSPVLDYELDISTDDGSNAQELPYKPAAPFAAFSATSANVYWTQPIALRAEEPGTEAAQLPILDWDLEQQASTNGGTSWS